MPQSRNWRVASDFVPNGKGSIFNRLVDISVATRKRALRMNEGEGAKLGSQYKLLDKYAHISRHHQDKVMGRVNHTLSELQAYKEVVDRDFRACHFDTLTWGYNFKEARHDPERMQRFVYETKIYHSGFIKNNFRRHIEKQKVLMHPDFLKTQEHLRRVEKIKKLTPVYEIPRTERSVTVILKDFHNHKTKVNKTPGKNPSELLTEGQVEEENPENESEHLEEEDKREEMNSHSTQRSPIILRREKTFKTSLEI